MSTRATATFEVTGWEQTPYDAGSDGVRLDRATVRKTFRGDLTAESTAELMMCLRGDEGLGYIASERVVGRLGDRAGTFVIQHGGVQEDGEPRSFGHVVPGSGTGSLAGLCGTVTYRHDADGAVFTLDYEIA